jgi:hypothetical protein
LEEKSALEQMRKFLSDPQVHTVLVERSTLKGAAGAGAAGRGDARGQPHSSRAGPRRGQGPPTPRGTGKSPDGLRRRALASLSPHPLPGPEPRGVPSSWPQEETRVPLSCSYPKQWGRFVCSGLSRWPSWVETASPDRARAEAASLPPVSHELFAFDSWPGWPASGGTCQGLTRGVAAWIRVQVDLARGVGRG